MFWGSNSLAQSITPEPGSTTQVIQTGDNIAITGGVQVQENLFQSFQDFNLKAQETATFYTNSSIQNVLGNVLGGNASIINGQINLIGSSANLFLINPAGILFGSQASLNVPAAFTATTATGIGFGQGALSWWTGNTNFDYSAFVGSPQGFYFTNGGSGTIVNLGNLQVAPGQSLTLLGSQVVNTGQLTAPGGHVLVLAQPNGQVRLTQPHMILGLEVDPLASHPGSLGITALDLPTLLTVGQTALGTDPSLIQGADGTVRLVRNQAIVPSQGGTAVISGQVDTQAQQGGSIAILGDRLLVTGARLDASGELGGGTIQVGGSYQGSGPLPNSVLTLVDSQSQLLANGSNSGGSGHGGTVIVWADDLTAFTGQVSSRGGDQGGNGGFVEISGLQNLQFSGTVDTNAPNGQIGTLLLDPQDIVIVDSSVLTGVLRAPGDSELLALGGVVTSDDVSSFGEPFTISEDQVESLLSGGDVILQATNTITLNDLADNTLGNFSGSLGNFTLTADGVITMVDPNDTIAINGTIALRGASLRLGNLNTFNGDVVLTSTLDEINVGTVLARDDIVIEGSSLSLGSLTSRSGNIFLESFLDGITVDTVSAPGGAVSMTSASFVTLTSTVTALDDSIDPTNLTSSGYSNPTGTIVINTNLGPEPPTVEGLCPVDDPDCLGNDLDSTEFGDELGDELGDEFGDELGDELGDTDFGDTNFEVDSEFDVEAYDEADSDFSNEFVNALSLDTTQVEGAPQTIADTQAAIARLAELTNTRAAVIYVGFSPSTIGSPSGGTSGPATQQLSLGGVQELPTDNLELIMVTAEGNPLRRTLRGVTRSQVMGMGDLFSQAVGTPEGLGGDRYLIPAQRLYNWLIRPLEPELQAQGINSLLFAMPSGLRSLPLAALHDGQQFLVETYSLGLTPSVSLTDLRYENVQGSTLLALGASNFSDQAPLPAVPVELQTITQEIWPGEALLNEQFTLENLIAERHRTSPSIIHLATHADFESGDISQSYIQLWNDRLNFNDLRQLRFDEGKLVELLVLSACRTALGNDQAELGFAGLAVKAGVKTSMASLWYVSDEGTLGLMTEFYRQLRDPIVMTKAEALRQAQLAMLRGDVTVDAGELRGPGFRGGGVTLPAQLANRGISLLSHPYYWAAFTLVGNPW